MRKRFWIFGAFAACVWGTSGAQQGDILSEAEFRGVLVECLEQVSAGPDPVRTRRDLLVLAACIQDSAEPPERSALSNDDIIALTESGVPASEIVSMIRQEPGNFDTSVEEVVKLVRAGVDSAVIAAMAEADAPVSGRAPGALEQVTGYTRRLRDALTPGQPRMRPFSDPLRSGGRGPEMVVIPAGEFQMGCIAGGCRRDEAPAHAVAISRPFALARHEVTFAQWDACFAAGGCGTFRPGDEGWGRGSRPVINVSLGDAEAYIRWLSRETGERYRLPSEAEWEYAARAGSRTRYPWGNEVGRNRANCADCGSRWDDSRTAPVGSFAPNGFGLHDMHGNVWERLADCWNDSYSRAPDDGRAWTRGNCRRNVLRGGSWSNRGRDLRSANRNENTRETRSNSLGFRVARDVRQ